jgi:hypothetical protein
LGISSLVSLPDEWVSLSSSSSKSSSLPEEESYPSSSDDEESERTLIVWGGFVIFAELIAVFVVPVAVLKASTKLSRRGRARDDDDIDESDESEDDLEELVESLAKFEIDKKDVSMCVMMRILNLTNR